VGRLVLVRHGESEGNRDRVFTLTPDVPITPRGAEQARASGLAIRDRYRPVHVVSSPFVRARQTAAIIAEVLGHPKDVEIVPDLCERSYGDLAGSPYDTPRPDHDPTRYWEWCPPGGETLAAVARRVGVVLDALASAWPSDDVVVVSHGGVMLALHKHVQGAWGTPRQVTRNAGIVVVEHRDGRYGPLVDLDAP
jgi:ribonuclease H / adenosylcobalamin/alpha-ribazole phosphatase